MEDKELRKNERQGGKKGKEKWKRQEQDSRRTKPGSQKAWMIFLLRRKKKGGWGRCPDIRSYELDGVTEMFLGREEGNRECRGGCTTGDTNREEGTARGAQPVVPG